MEKEFWNSRHRRPSCRNQCR
ncbi:unnamed protein product [Oikopleura dioica]|uniref:Uncharacterized protein n=1 Tax=Oikopleura dioica TaxID=34765 RepID=E4Y6V1_OIKDI|nr:unnamed protein product [Oikopleura dioica]